MGKSLQVREKAKREVKIKGEMHWPVGKALATHREQTEFMIYHPEKRGFFLFRSQALNWLLICIGI